jgi:hypothetical protein
MAAADGDAAGVAAIGIAGFGSGARHLVSGIVDFPGRVRRTDEKEIAMQYLLMIYDNEKRWTGGYGPEEMGEYQAYGKEFAGAIRGGNALLPTNTAKTVRVRDGKRSVTDGPFAETKEQLAGFYLMEAASMDEALVMAEKVPGAKYGSIEVRPIMTFK